MKFTIFIHISKDFAKDIYILFVSQELIIFLACHRFS